MYIKECLEDIRKGDSSLKAFLALVDESIGERESRKALNSKITKLHSHNLVLLYRQKSSYIPSFLICPNAISDFRLHHIPLFFFFSFL